MEIGDKGLIIRRGLKPLTIPLGAPQVGDKVVCMPDGNRQSYVAIPLGTPQVGDTVALLPEGGTRRYVAVPLEAVPPDPCGPGRATGIIINGDFETGSFPPWVLTNSILGEWSISTVEKYEGVYGAYCDIEQAGPGQSWGGIEQTLDLRSTDYISGYIKGSTNWNNVFFEPSPAWGGIHLSLLEYVTSEWTKFCFKIGDIPLGDGVQTVGFFAYTYGPGHYWLALDKVVLHRV